MRGHDERVDQNQDQVNLREEQIYAPHRNSNADPNPIPPPANSKTPSPPQPVIRYRECLKNHAASLGGHVTDGCGEFMPSGEEGTLEGLKCAACDCHRNFHRREVEGESQSGASSYYPYNPHRNSTIVHRTTTTHLAQPPPPLPLPRPPPPAQHHHRFSHAPIPPGMMAFGGGALAESSSEDLNMFHLDAVIGQPSSFSPSSKKRFRTKFTQEQKDKMQNFAEKLGWKLQKQNEEEMRQFCAETGVKRQVFKVWMHNSKQAMKKKTS